MTTFRQSVFFLTTAEEELERFFGQEKSEHLVSSHCGPDLFAPGTYLIRDGRLVRDETLEQGDEAAADPASA